MNMRPIDVYSVTRLNREARTILESRFPCIWLEGEISNLARPTSGHIYFSLKDAQAQVRCAMFRNRIRRFGFAPENGIQVLVRANVSLYEGRGEFQLIIEEITPAGAGGLQQAFEALKQTLFKQGLFAEAHKLPIPKRPKAIGVISSPTGAALGDILVILARRYALAEVIIYPVLVQGDAAAEQLGQALKIAQTRQECDVLILARGGGTIEDLWAFNNEALAQAIFDCRIPIVTGIGHEIDYTIADFVADARAATPSAAAELVSPDQLQLQQSLARLQSKLVNLCRDRLALSQNNTRYLQKRLVHPAARLQHSAQYLDSLSMRLSHSLKIMTEHRKQQLHSQWAALSQYNPLPRFKFYRASYESIQIRLGQSIYYFHRQLRARLETASKALHAISPLATLSRGYAIVQKYNSREIIRDAAKLTLGDEILSRFRHGQAKCTVTEIFNTHRQLMSKNNKES